jgi:hypothetical protein
MDVIKIMDMPKIESPFIRKIIDGFYVITPEINPDYKWVFEDESVMAIEKLDGTNVSIVVQDGDIKQIYNRTQRIPFFNKGKKFITEAVLNSFDRGYCNFTDGQYFGEVIGQKLQGNPYKLDEHLWIPFSTYCQEHLRYKSWGKYPKDFETISNWFKDDIFSLFLAKRGIKEKPEGVVFTHPDGRMAKLRRDMFPWFEGDSHHRHKSKEVIE